MVARPGLSGVQRVGATVIFGVDKAGGGDRVERRMESCNC